MPNANRYYSTMAIRKLHTLALGGETAGINLTNLDDVIITTPVSNHVLRYNGTNWVNTQLAHVDLSGIGTNAHSAIDTAITNSTNHIAATSNPHGVTLTQNSITLTSGILTTPNDNLIMSSSLYSIYLRPEASQYVIIDTGLGLRVIDKIGIGLTPTARLHLPAGTATANTAPLKLTSPGVLLTTLELGAIEFVDNGTTGSFYITMNVAGVLTRVLIK